MSSTQRTITKALGGAEDLLFGQGAVAQIRNGVEYPISKINSEVIPYTGDQATGDLVSVKAQLDTLTTFQAALGTDDIAGGKGIVMVSNSVIHATRAEAEALEPVEGRVLRIDGADWYPRFTGGPFVSNGATVDAPGTRIAYTANTLLCWERKYEGGVNPLWFGAKGDYNYTLASGTDDTAAFIAAAAEGPVVVTACPGAGYMVTNLPVTSGYTLYGVLGTSAPPTLILGTSSSAIFLAQTTTGDIGKVAISNIECRCGAGVLGGKVYSQTNFTYYSSYVLFSGIESRVEFEVTYEGLFIFLEISDCRDGYKGTVVGGQTHQALYSHPATYGQTKQTNLNRICNTQFFKSTSSNGAVHLSYGAGWRFDTVDFEASTTAVLLDGVSQVSMQTCWFEAIANSPVIKTTVSAEPNPQASVGLAIDGCFFNLDALSTTPGHVIGLTATVHLRLTNSMFIRIPVGCTLTNRPENIREQHNNAASVGATEGFLVRPQRANIEFTTGIVNSPQSLNANILPVGPTSLGAANFTNSGFTAKADVASAIGPGTALALTLAGDGQTAYYTIPPKLLPLLQGRTVTLVMAGWGDAAGSGDWVDAAIWESTPTYGTEVASTYQNINIGNENLQFGYVTYTFSEVLTEVHIGLTTGGVTGSPVAKIEVLGLYLGEIKPELLSLH